MNKTPSAFPVSALVLLATLAACSRPAEAPAPPAAEADPARAAETPVVPDLGAESRWKRTTDGKVLVTPDNFIRAESDTYMAAQVKQGALGKLHHNRTVASLDNQVVIRLNRDTLYSSGVFDLDAGPVTITLPDPGERFMSLMVLNEDHFVPSVFYGGGTHTLARESVGTRYVLLGIRTLVDPNNPEDVKQVHALQDAITVSQAGGPGTFEIPDWDAASQKKVRDALLALAATTSDMRYAAGPDSKSVDPVRRLMAAAAGWGLNPDKDAVYVGVAPPQNDGRTVYRLTVKDVPVDAFWSVSVYSAEGYFVKNDLDAYSINNITGKKDADGSITIQFGDCRKDTPNCLPITKGWNYTVRLYRPRAEILDGTWSFPEPQPLR